MALTFLVHRKSEKARVRGIVTAIVRRCRFLTCCGTPQQGSAGVTCAGGAHARSPGPTPQRREQQQASSSSLVATSAAQSWQLCRSPHQHFHRHAGDQFLNLYYSVSFLLINTAGCDRERFFTRERFRGDTAPGCVVAQSTQLVDPSSLGPLMISGPISTSPGPS